MSSRTTNPASLVEVLDHWSIQTPDRSACRFLSFTSGPEPELTYQQLGARARTIAAAVQDRARRGDRLILLYPPGLEFVAAFVGSLHAGTVAVPVYPPDPARARRDLAKLRAIIADARPAMILSTAAVKRLIDAAGPATSDLAAHSWLETDTLDLALAAQWRNPGVTSSEIAFLQYTSGSTGQPKGVMVSHGNLMSNLRCIRGVFDGDTSPPIVSWLPLYHDMGLIGNLLHGLNVGTTCLLMSPIDFLEQPLRWLETISRHRALLSGGPNFAYELCVRKIAPEQRRALDLSSWRVAFNGAEPIRRATIDRFVAAFEPHGFRPESLFPCYGLAEATLMVSGSWKPLASRFEQLETAALERDVVAAVPASGEPDPAATAGRWFVGCGRAVPDHRIEIVDPVSCARRAPDQIGEIWVAGPSVGQGYWGKPEHTAQTFGATLSDGDGPFLRTGDLGFVRDGELFVTGRLKDVIIVRGRNHYPQDIELTAEQAHPALRPGCSAAFALEGDATERLALVCEVDRRYRDSLVDPTGGVASPAEAIAAAVSQRIAEHHDLELQVLVLIEAGRIPKTTSGKIQRSACRSGYANGKLATVATWNRPAIAAGSSAPSDPSAPAAPTAPADHDRAIAAWRAAPEAERPARLAAWLRGVAADVLAVPPEQLPAQAPLIQLGLSSLTAVELRGLIERATGAALSIAEVLQAADLAALADLVASREAAAPVTRPAISAGPTERVLSFAQQRLWFLAQLEPDSADYNECLVLRLTGPLRRDVLERALHAVIARHDVLRTAFSATHDGTAVRVSDTMSAADIARDMIEMLDVAALPPDARSDEAMRRIRELADRPFDLSRPPLLRAALAAIDAEHHLFAMVIHHILCDAHSARIVCDELAALYDAGVRGVPATLPALAAQYGDLARWERDRLSGDVLDGLVRYWRRQLVHMPTSVMLPVDHAHAPATGGRGQRIRFALSAEVSRELRALARRERATAPAAVLAALFAILHRYSGQDDLPVGMPVSGRERPEAAPLIGMFVNTLVMRGDLSGDPTFRELVARTGACVVAGLEHQSLPFDLLVAALRPERRATQSPLFNVMFSFAGAPMPAFVAGELSCAPLSVDRSAARFDLTMNVTDAADGFTGSFEYDAARFDAATIQRLAGDFEALVRAAVAVPERRISELPLLGGAHGTPRVLEVAAPAPPPSQPAQPFGALSAARGSEPPAHRQLTSRIATLSPEKRALLMRNLHNKTTATSVIRARRRTSDRAPCSFAQQRLWFLHQLEPASCAYNMPGVLRVRGRLDIAVLRLAMDEVNRRHDSLRTTFVEVDGQPMQVIAPPSGQRLREIDLQHLPAAEREREAVRLADEEAHTPFDLATGPVVRTTLIHLGPDDFTWLWTMHHIISDGWATSVLINEIVALYGAFLLGKPSPLPELTIQYADFAIWQREYLQGAVLDEHMAYWKTQLGSDLPTLNLPTDFPRPPAFSDRGGGRVDVFDHDQVNALKQLCQHERVTLFIALSVAVQAVLHAATGQDDIVIGTDVANRNRVETENLIGFCINQLVLRTQLAGNPSFRELIARTWKVALGAYAHQDMPFDLLVKELNPRRAANRTPLFQAKLVLQNAPAPPLRLPGVTIESVQLATHTSKFDIMFSAQEDEHGLRLNTIYNADLFKPSTIERHVRHLDFTIKTMVAEPDLRLDRYLRRLNELETEYQQSRQAQFKNASRQRLQLNRQKDNRRASTP